MVRNDQERRGEEREKIRGERLRKSKVGRGPVHHLLKKEEDTAVERNEVEKRLKESEGKKEKHGDVEKTPRAATEEE